MSNNQKSASEQQGERKDFLCIAHHGNGYERCQVQCISCEKEEVTIPPTPSEPSELVQKIGDGRIVFNGETYVNEKSKRVSEPSELEKGLTAGIDVKATPCHGDYSQYSEPSEVEKGEREREEDLLINYEETTYKPAKPVQVEIPEEVKEMIIGFARWQYELSHTNTPEWNFGFWVQTSEAKKLIQSALTQQARTVEELRRKITELEITPGELYCEIDELQLERRQQQARIEELEKQLSGR